MARELCEQGFWMWKMVKIDNIPKQFNKQTVKERLKKIFGRKVDLLTQESISPYLRNEILNSMKIIYEKR